MRSNKEGELEGRWKRTGEKRCNGEERAKGGGVEKRKGWKKGKTEGN